MTHSDFVVWMLVYPMVVAAIKVAEYQWTKREEYSDSVRAMAGLIQLVIWFGVGAKLY